MRNPEFLIQCKPPEEMGSQHVRTLEYYEDVLTCFWLSLFDKQIPCKTPSKTQQEAQGTPLLFVPIHPTTFRI